MKKSNKIYLFVVCLCLVLAIVGCNKNQNSGSSDANNSNASAVTIKKYIESSDNLIYDKWLFTPQQSNIMAKAMGKQCGITDTKKQVFEIEGQSPNNWVCMINEGVVVVYREQAVSYVSIKEFQPKKVKVKDTNSSQVKKEIVDSNIINKTISDMNDKNLVNMPEAVSLIKNIEFESDRYPGLILAYLFVHDESQNCFIIDRSANMAWKIGHELMDSIM